MSTRIDEIENTMEVLSKQAETYQKQQQQQQQQNNEK
jgi:hypothetical protein